MTVTPMRREAQSVPASPAKVALQRLKLFSFALVHRSPEPLFRPCPADSKSYSSPILRRIFVPVIDASRMPGVPPQLRSYDGAKQNW
jgi:hypothetical protein